MKCRRASLTVGLGLISAGLLVIGLFWAPIPWPSGTGNPPPLVCNWPSSTVYVENHADPRWPVRQVAADLDKQTILTVLLVDRCPAGKPCITVRSVPDIPPPDVGLTTLLPSRDQVSHVEISLDDSWGAAVFARRRHQLTCHELGHAVGLDHNNGSCMTVGSSGHYTQLSPAERQLLDHTY